MAPAHTETDRQPGSGLRQNLAVIERSRRLALRQAFANAMLRRYGGTPDGDIDHPLRGYS